MHARCEGRIGSGQGLGKSSAKSRRCTRIARDWVLQNAPKVFVERKLLSRWQILRRAKVQRLPVREPTHAAGQQRGAGAHLSGRRPMSGRAVSLSEAHAEVQSTGRREESHSFTDAGEEPSGPPMMEIALIFTSPSNLQDGVCLTTPRMLASYSRAQHNRSGCNLSGPVTDALGRWDCA